MNGTPANRHPDHYPRTALVTGAARRIGRAIALDLARGGWAVAVHHRTSRAEARDVVASIEASGGRAVALEADLAREAETEALIRRATDALGPVGVLVNNASLFEHDTVKTATRESWDRHMEPNVRAPLVLAQAFARALPPEAGGAIVNLLDQRVWNPTPYFLSYTVSKSALWTLTRTLALALAPRIRVNGIGPGPTLPSARQSEAQFARQCAETPLGRGSTPEEICAAVRFILEARSMTGQMIALDGGQHQGWTQPARSDESFE
ncbi:MAG: SDR family oxidoreductase [Kiloniellaceae bacterium]